MKLTTLNISCWVSLLFVSKTAVKKILISPSIVSFSGKVRERTLRIERVRSRTLFLI